MYKGAIVVCATPLLQPKITVVRPTIDSIGHSLSPKTRANSSNTNRGPVERIRALGWVQNGKDTPEKWKIGPRQLLSHAQQYQNGPKESHYT
jgi:hypothetical protein